jgi:ATP-dependent Clp protease adaptor protein ClpS
MTENHVPPITQPDAEQELHTLLQPEHGDLTQIIVHNDDVTPYDFVIRTLGSLFLLSEEIADHIAWTAHTKGAATVAVRSRAEAEKLVKVAHGRAKAEGYPLTFTLEQE